MDFEWDKEKCLINMRKHGVDFVDVPSVFDTDVVTVEDDRYNYGEQRFVTFGLLNGREIAVVHTDDGNLIRIISARRATKHERRNYFEQV
jgi:uncharacterized protein